MIEHGSVSVCDSSQFNRSSSGMGRAVAMDKSSAWHSSSEAPPEVAEGDVEESV